MKFDIQELEYKIIKWNKKNFGGHYSTGYRNLLGVMEEVGELAHAHLKKEQNIRMEENHDEKKKDAIGDIVIFLINYADSQGLTLSECIHYSWEQIKNRDWSKQ